MKNQLIIVAHDIRSTHNVGALLRTAEGLAVNKVVLTGYTPYPLLINDERLPHISAKIDKQIHKTALGAELMVQWEHHDDVNEVLMNYRSRGFTIAGLEQTKDSVLLNALKVPEKLVIVLGSEVEGIHTDLIDSLDLCIEIPMYGKKASFNVIEAASMAMYHCRFMV